MVGAELPGQRPRTHVALRPLGPRKRPVGGQRPAGERQRPWLSGTRSGHPQGGGMVRVVVLGDSIALGCTCPTRRPSPTCWTYGTTGSRPRTWRQGYGPDQGPRAPAPGAAPDPTSWSWPLPGQRLRRCHAAGLGLRRQDAQAAVQPGGRAPAAGRLEPASILAMAGRAVPRRRVVSPQPPVGTRWLARQGPGLPLAGPVRAAVRDEDHACSSTWPSSAA
jgi:hypothetical protein